MENRWQDENLHLSGKKERFRRKNTSDEKYKTDVTVRSGGKMQVEGVMLERDSISRIEGGERFVADYELRVFAKVLGVDVKWLLNEECS